MSNQACLFGEDTPTPYDPFAEGSEPGTNTALIAGAAYQIPAYWLCCFDKPDIVVLQSEEGDIPQLVCEMARVRSRLAEREAAAKALFAAYQGAWDEFRWAVEATVRKYLKLDTYEICILHQNDGEFARQLKKALNWFGSGKKVDLDALLSLAGIEAYDSKTGSFSSGSDDPERFLCGWLEE